MGHIENNIEELRSNQLNLPQETIVKFLSQGSVHLTQNNKLHSPLLCSYGDDFKQDERQMPTRLYTMHVIGFQCKCL